MKNPQVGVRIARRVREAEHALDQALLQTSALVGAMIEGRLEAGLAAEVGQPALEGMVHAMGQLTRARASVVRGHSDLVVIADNQGIAWRMDGPLESKTTDSPVRRVG